MLYLCNLHRHDHANKITPFSINKLFFISAFVASCISLQKCLKWVMRQPSLVHRLGEYKWTLVALLWVTVQQLIWQGECIHTCCSCRLCLRRLNALEISQEAKTDSFDVSSVQSFLYYAHQEYIGYLPMIAAGVADGHLFESFVVDFILLTGDMLIAIL